MRAADRRDISRLPRRAVHAALVAVLLAQAWPHAVAQDAPLAQAELVLQTGHTGSVNALALSPDGRFLVSGSEDVTLKIWDTATGNVLRTLSGHEQSVLAAAISPDGRTDRLRRRRCDRARLECRDGGIDEGGVAFQRREERGVQRRWPAADVAREQRDQGLRPGRRPRGHVGEVGRRLRAQGHDVSRRSSGHGVVAERKAGGSGWRPQLPQRRHGDRQRPAHAADPRHRRRDGSRGGIVQARRQPVEPDRPELQSRQPPDRREVRRARREGSRPAQLAERVRDRDRP